MLDGTRVLIVEDDPIIAADLTGLIEQAGGKVIGHMTGVVEVKQALPNLWADVAVLDLNVADGQITPVLEALLARRVAVVVYTGGELPPDVKRRHPDLVVLHKPVQPARLLGELRKVKRAASR